MASAAYTIGKQHFLSGDADLDTATIKAMLVSSSYTFSASETTIATAAGNRLGTDQTLSSKSVANGIFDAADATWSAVASGSTAIGVVIYRFVSNDTDSVPLVFIDIADTATNGGDITLQWDNGANKIFGISG